MSSKHLRGDFNYAWPTAEVAVMGAKVCGYYLQCISFYMYYWQDIKLSLRQTPLEPAPAASFQPTGCTYVQDCMQVLFNKRFIFGRLTCHFILLHI